MLGGKAIAASGREPGVAEELDGDLTAEIFALSQVNDAHATFAEQADDSVRAEILEGRLLALRSVAKDFVRHERDIAIEKRGSCGVFLEQRFDFRDEGLVAFAGDAQVGAMFRSREIGGFVKYGLDSIPARAVHLSSG